MSIPPPAFEVMASSITFGRKLARRVDRELAAQGLTWGHFHALVVLEREGGWLRPASLAHRIGVTRQAAHTLMARLDDRGFLRWKVDGRIRSARLTDDGITALASAWEAVERIVDAIERTTIDERSALVAAQRSVIRELRRPPMSRSIYYDLLPDDIKPFHTPSVAPLF